MNIEREETQLFRLCVILTATVGVDICGTIGVPDIINKPSVTNASDGKIGIKEYANEGNEKFWPIKDNIVNLSKPPK